MADPTSPVCSRYGGPCPHPDRCFLACKGAPPEGWTPQDWSPISADRWTGLRRTLDDYRSTGSASLTDLVRVALDAADADALVARLQGDPDLAVEVAGRLRVAGEWRPAGNRPSDSRLRHDTRSGRLLARAWRAWPERGPRGGPCWTDDEGFTHSAESLEAAMAAADAALIAAGWSLAGGDR